MASSTQLDRSPTILSRRQHYSIHDTKSSCCANFVQLWFLELLLVQQLSGRASVTHSTQDGSEEDGRRMPAPTTRTSLDSSRIGPLFELLQELSVSPTPERYTRRRSSRNTRCHLLYRISVRSSGISTCSLALEVLGPARRRLELNKIGKIWESNAGGEPSGCFGAIPYLWNAVQSRMRFRLRAIDDGGLIMTLGDRCW